MDDQRSSAGPLNMMVQRLNQAIVRGDVAVIERFYASGARFLTMGTSLHGAAAIAAHLADPMAALRDASVETVWAIEPADAIAAGSRLNATTPNQGAVTFDVMATLRVVDERDRHRARVLPDRSRWSRRVTLCLRGRCLPDGEQRELFLDADRISFDPVPGAEMIHDGGWLIPGLVDVHTHPGAHEPGDQMADDVLLDDLSRHADAGVALIRTPGIAGGIVPHWATVHAHLPRIVPAGHWLAAVDGFFPGWGRQLDPTDLPAAAVEEAGRAGGWCEVVVDWASGEGAARRYHPTVPPEVVVAVVNQVHAVGGRVAVHSQHPDGAEAAVVAGADSLEHGMHLRHELLERMAAQGTVLVPTMTAFAELPARIAALDAPTWMSRYLEQGWQRHPELVTAAHQAGVTVLAGTDSTPHGSVAGEVELLAAAGLPAAAALGAASWSARRFLGYPCLDEGGLADITVYDDDPTINIDILRHPALIISKGQLRRPHR